MVDVPGLEPHHAAGYVYDAGRDPVRPKPVDDADIADLPEQGPEPHGWADEDAIVQLVEIPLMEEEIVEKGLLAGEFHTSWKFC